MPRLLFPASAMDSGARQVQQPRQQGRSSSCAQTSQLSRLPQYARCAVKAPVPRGSLLDALTQAKENKGMTKREVVQTILAGKRPPYVPWSFDFTQEAAAKLAKYYRRSDLDIVLNNHIVGLGNPVGFFEPLGNDLYRDVFGVV